MLQLHKYSVPLSFFLTGGIAQTLGPNFTAYTLNSSTTTLSYIVRVPKNGNISTIRIRVNSVTSGQAIRAGIYTVDGSGVPTSTAYGGMVAGTATPSAGGELVFTLGTAAAATMNDCVAVKLEWDSTQGNVSIHGGGNFHTRDHYVYHNGAKAMNAPVISLGYDDSTYPPMIGALATTHTTNPWSGVTYNVDTGTFDEYGLRFKLPYRVRLRGMLVSLGCAAGADFEYLNYRDTSGVGDWSTSAVVVVNATNMSATRDGDHTGSTGNGFYCLLWSEAEELAPNTERILAIRPTQTANVTLGFIRPGASAVMESVFGTDWHLAKRLSTSGAWNLTDNLHVPMILPIFDQLEDGGASHRGQLVTAPSRY